MTIDKRHEQEEIEAAASEAGEIGGTSGSEYLAPEDRPVSEAGGGESEGFEEARRQLIEHASHGDEQPAHAILHDRGPAEEAVTDVGGEADFEPSSALADPGENGAGEASRQR